MFDLKNPYEGFKNLADQKTRGRPKKQETRGWRFGALNAHAQAIRTENVEGIEAPKVK